MKNQLAPVNLFFLYFPAEIFEFSFNSRWKIGWPPGHLERVFLVFELFILKVVKPEAVGRSCSIKKVFLKIFSKFTGEHLYLSLAQVISCEFYEIFKNIFFITPPVAPSVKLVKVSEREISGFFKYLIE